MNTGGEIPRHLVVFDCNIFLDVADLLGGPFTWAKFDAEVARISRDRVPHPVDKAYDSLRAVAVCTSGRFAGEEILEVWTSSHIDTLVRGKAEQPVERDSVTGYKGLGWRRDHAQELIDELVSGHSRVISPSVFVALVRAARMQYSVRRMKPPTSPNWVP